MTSSRASCGRLADRSVDVDIVELEFAHRVPPSGWYWVRTGACGAGAVGPCMWFYGSGRSGSPKARSLGEALLARSRRRAEQVNRSRDDRLARNSGCSAHQTTSPASPARIISAVGTSSAGSSATAARAQESGDDLGRAAPHLRAGTRRSRRRRRRRGRASASRGRSPARSGTRDRGSRAGRPPRPSSSRDRSRRTRACRRCGGASSAM